MAPGVHATTMVPKGTEMLQQLKDAINGKKTYLLSVAAIISAALAWSQDAISFFEMVEAVGMALGFSTIRHGVTTEALKHV